MRGRLFSGTRHKKGARIEIQPRFKIQYPMKNRGNINLNISSVQYPKPGIFPPPVFHDSEIKFCGSEMLVIFAPR